MSSTSTSQSSYLVRGERTIGELQRDAEAKKQIIREETKAQMVLEVLIEKQTKQRERFLRVFAPEATSTAAKEELISILDNNPEHVLLEEHIPVMPMIFAIVAGKLRGMVSIDATNNVFMSDDAAVALGAVIGSCRHAANLQSVYIGGTEVRCRGVRAIIEGVVKRAAGRRVTFTLSGLGTEIFEDSEDELKALRALITQHSSNTFVIELE